MSLRAWSSARWTVPLPPGHRFPIAKYALIRDAVVASGTLSPGAIADPERVSIEALHLVHEPFYVTSILDGSLDADQVMAMIDDSYDLVVASLPRAEREAIIRGGSRS